MLARKQPTAKLSTAPNYRSWIDSSNCIWLLTRVHCFWNLMSTKFFIIKIDFMSI